MRRTVASQFEARGALMIPDDMRARKRSLLSFAAVAVGVVTVSAIGGAIWFVASHRQSASASATVAETEFAQLRSRFTNQPPLVDMATRTAVVQPVRPTAASPLRVFHTVIFDTRGGERLIHISAPYWFARRFARHDGTFVWLGELTFLDDTEFDPEAIRLSLTQLERHGPGLVVDYRRPSGGQFVSWVE
jgi:hypothetical protein